MSKTTIFIAVVGLILANALTACGTTSQQYAKTSFTTADGKHDIAGALMPMPYERFLPDTKSGNTGAFVKGRAIDGMRDKAPDAIAQNCRPYVAEYNQRTRFIETAPTKNNGDWHRIDAAMTKASTALQALTTCEYGKIG